jgi:acyl transferase domain-containing protein
VSSATIRGIYVARGRCEHFIYNTNLAPGLWVGMSAQMTLSPDGSSKTFDTSADGYARGDGVTALYVKRLDEAIRDGNPVRAIFRTSSSNADARTLGITMPSTDAQEALICRRYEVAGPDVPRTAIVECHGTGTAVGDPMEVAAVARCFYSRKRAFALGQSSRI